MQYRTDPKSGNKLSALGFGCMRFSTRRGSIDQTKAEKLIRKAIDGGVNYFDTAYIYPGSETSLGRALSGGLRDKVYIATKLPILLCRSENDLEKYFRRQLERLRTDRVDYYLIHMLQDCDRWRELCALGIEDWLLRLKRDGAVGQVGFSFHGHRGDFERLLAEYDWDFCQIQYNYVDENNQAGKQGLQAAAAMGIPVMVMEPLLGGKLASALPKAAAEVFHKADPGQSPAERGLRWVWNHSEVTLLLSGMNDESQLEENIRIAEDALPDKLTDRELEVYNEAMTAFAASFKVHCTGCSYCMPCPKGVDIPSCFAAYNAMFGISKGTGRHQYMQLTGGLTPNRRYASLCEQCGACEKKCPQGIKIRDELKEVARIMEPFWFRPAMSVARTFSKGRRK